MRSDRPAPSPDPLSPPGSASTKERILDAAEELFADLGYEATSLRTLTRHADVNLAAVHYHFGSKQSLLSAVVARRIELVNRERLELLELARRSAGTGGVVPLRPVLEALFGPPLRLARREDVGFERFLRIVGRLNSSTDEHALELRDELHQVHQHFLPVLQAALPHLRAADLRWRFDLLIGAMSTLFTTRRFAGRTAEDGHGSGERELAELIAFAEGALGAPSGEVREA